jgi:Uma2 family endonuclease
MVAEIVSDSSVGKDTKRLPAAYFAAGVKEYWLVDARAENMQFTIHTRGEQAFEPMLPGADAYQASPVFARAFHLTRERNRRGNWKYDLLMK